MVRPLPLLEQQWEKLVNVASTKKIDTKTISDNYKECNQL
jgi:hypothetical protein